MCNEVNGVDIDGWLTERESRLLYRLARNCTGQGVIVEIGAWKGKSTVCLARGSKAGNSVPVLSIDPHNAQYMGDYNTFPVFSDNIKAAGVQPLVTSILKTSHDVASSWERPIELLFIDGSHYLDDVLNDFLNFSPWVVPGGVVAFDDSTAYLRTLFNPWHYWNRQRPGRRRWITGWPGVRHVVNKLFLPSPHYDDFGLVDTITYGVKQERRDLYKSRLGRKLIPDLFNALVFMPLRHIKRLDRHPSMRRSGKRGKRTSGVSG